MPPRKLRAVGPPRPGLPDQTRAELFQDGVADVPETMAILHVSERKVRYLLARGDLTQVRSKSLGRKTLIPRRQIFEMLAEET